MIDGVADHGQVLACAGGFTGELGDDDHLLTAGADAAWAEASAGP